MSLRSGTYTIQNRATEFYITADKDTKGGDPVKTEEPRNPGEVPDNTVSYYCTEMTWLTFW